MAYTIAQITAFVEKLRAARTPETIFGDLSGDLDDVFPVLRERFVQILKEYQLHPDAMPGEEHDALAAEGFQLLRALYERATYQVRYGGTPPAPGVQITSRRHTYTVAVASPLTWNPRAEITNTLACSWEAGGVRHGGVFKIARAPDDADLLQNEASILRLLHTDGDADYTRFLPSVVETFAYAEPGQPPRQTNILTFHESIAAADELYSLSEVRDTYPEGIDPRDMAWMWRRLLTVLGYLHRRRVVHGAVLPINVLIEPVDHKLVLVEWLFAIEDPVTNDQHLRGMFSHYADFYPPEVAARTPPTPATDIYMAARTMIELIGGLPALESQPALKRYFQRALNTTAAMHPGDAWKMLSDFDRLIEGLWGARTFRVFAMPPRTNR